MGTLDRKFHFISGLPRSGSTLLAGILRQNPRFHAAISSPVAGLINGALEQMGAAGESWAFFDERKRRTISRALLDAYYADAAAEVVFDTNRFWTARMHQLAGLVDGFKVICCVRNPAWIMDSFEAIHRRNPFDYSRMFNAATRQTVYSRCDQLINAGGTVGGAWTALKEAYYGEFSDRLLLVDYELLTRHPARTMELVYRFLGEAEFAHDFDNVEYAEETFDQNLGVQGLHTVRRKVEFKSRRSILPPDLFAKYQDMDFWQDQTGTSAGIVAARRTDRQHTDTSKDAP
ncbi:sulfotransferase [Lysobacter sp. S4-A87]|uniref:sulfotransferase family protein n=1 Tax=Lysobacter sp. S4-A87 TaxID=2925843 RepID=UPI001F52D4A7|nr:sulfotransferase [Lysobacter sp. S4-A87]UNK48808.1 sulfotransferase [Lysobacter sp. S4-A87]